MVGAGAAVTMSRYAIRFGAWGGLIQKPYRPNTFLNNSVVRFAGSLRMAASSAAR